MVVDLSSFMLYHGPKFVPQIQHNKILLNSTHWTYGKSFLILFELSFTALKATAKEVFEEGQYAKMKITLFGALR